MLLNRHEIIARARSQENVRYQKDQYVPGLALDCVGLIRYAYDYQEDLDLRLYSKVLTSDSLVQGAKKLGFVETNTPQPADIIIWEYSGHPYHTGIYTGDNSCIHSSAAYMKVFEHEITGEWVDRLVCYLTFQS